MSLQNQLVDLLLNGAGTALLDGELVRVSANRTVTRTNAASTAGVVGFIGAVSVAAPVAPGGPVNVVTGGVAKVRMETGLTLSAGQSVYLSGTVAGAGTNVEPGANAVSFGVIKDTTGYTVSNPYVVVDMGAFANIANSEANWNLDAIRYYAVDYDNGNDANIGYSDVSMAAAGLVAVKTFTQLRRILPSNGAGRLCVIGAKPRSGGANYLKPDGVTIDNLDLRGVGGYLWLSVQGTTDFSDSAADRLQVGGLQVLAGPNADGSWTVAGGATTSLFSVAAGALTAEPGLLGYRFRFTGNVTAGLLNVCGGIWKNTGTAITPMRNVATTPAAGDTFFIERPGVWVDNLLTGPLPNTPINDNQQTDATLEVIGVRFRETTLTGNAVFRITQSIRFSFCEWDKRGPFINDCSGDINLGETAFYCSAPTTIVRPGPIRILRTLGALAGVLAQNSNGSIFVGSTAFVSTNNTGVQLFRVDRVSFGGGCVAYGSQVFIATAGNEIPGVVTGNTFFSVIGNSGSSTTRRLRLVGDGASTVALIRLHTGSKFSVFGLDASAAGALPVMQIAGGYNTLDIDDFVSTDGGNNDVAIDTTNAYASDLWLGLSAANTIAPAAGNMRTPGPQIITFAAIAAAGGSDVNQNRYIGAALGNAVLTANLPAAGALPNGSQVIENNAGTFNLVQYINGQRWRYAGAGPF